MQMFYPKEKKESIKQKRSWKYNAVFMTTVMLRLKTAALNLKNYISPHVTLKVETFMINRKTHISW